MSCGVLRGKMVLCLIAGLCVYRKSYGLRKEEKKRKNQEKQKSRK